MLPVVVIEENESDLERLCLLLKSAELAVQSFPDPSQYLSSPMFKRPHVAVICLTMESFAPLDIIEIASTQSSAVGIFCVTDQPDTRQIVSALKLGVTDIFDKPAPVAPIIQLATGHAHHPPALNNKIIAVAGQKLTSREDEVFQGILADQTNKQIARHLGITQRTVETHRAKLYAKLSVTSQSELIRKFTA